MMKRLLVVLLSLLLLIFALAGCDSATDGDGDGGGGDGGGDGGDDPGELGWAFDIADGVSEVEDLLIILGGYIDGDGELDDQMGTWTFIFGDVDGSQNQVYQVTVFPDGSHGAEWVEAGSYDPFWTAIPEYRSAADWVAAADDAVSGTAYESRTLMVEYDGLGEFTAADNICWMVYLNTDYQPVAMVILDADDDDVLDTFIY
jgi:predicted small secreted protein